MSKKQNPLLLKLLQHPFKGWALLLFFSFSLTAQPTEILPRGFSPSEILNPAPINFTNINALTNPPSGAVRAMAEWEELDALVITWDASFFGGIANILKNIARHAKEEVEVIIVCENGNALANSFLGQNIDTAKITFVEDNFNSIWVRDYGPNTVYLNDVEEQYFVDWIYNRPRPFDDAVVPEAIAATLDLPLYATTDQPTALVHTGGNFMSDGMGTAFSSRLVLLENEMQNQQQVEGTMNAFMGIDRYALMDVLTFDPIDHIDMHMKLLDEETLLVGEYPEGVADGPQIEANLQYVLDNFTTAYGNPFEVIRIPMPPQNGYYPDGVIEGDYRTYTNAVFVNKTILVPTYEEQFDTTALRIWRKAMPGYKIRSINSNAIIPYNGAIHCITKEVGTAEPLLINHSKIRKGCVNRDQLVEATVQHKSGIASVNLHFTTDTLGGYETVEMTNTVENTWAAMLPPVAELGEMFYYVHALANDGKEITRPIVAPAGYWKFPLEECLDVGTKDLIAEIKLEQIYPNPANGITVVPVKTSQQMLAKLEMSDVLGRNLTTLFSGRLTEGEHNFFIHAHQYAAGTYFVSLKTEQQTLVQKLIIR